MSALKKSQLYSKLWRSCDELRGGMDASEYKNYILTLLFMKYVSDKYANDEYSPIVIPSGGSFNDMLNARNENDLGERIDKIIGKLVDANQTLKGVVDVVSFNDPTKLGTGKEMHDKLSGMLSSFESLNFKNNRANDDDILGDAYEYLMRNFATESGKSKGQFYTPAEVSRVLAKVVGIGKSKGKKVTLYDPACGSGSLLIKAAREAESSVSIYGQEYDGTTAGLAKMNMFLHNFSEAEIVSGDTLSTPKYVLGEGILKQFDYVVVNPPFSLKSWTQGVNVDKDVFGRWSKVMCPPLKNGDYAWLLHVLHSLKDFGRGAVILPHGVLFRGNSEESIRKFFVDSGFIEGIIGLPANLFYGTGIPACIVVLDKALASHRDGIFIIDASHGFVKDGNKNRLREQDIRKIIDVYLNKREIDKYSRFVSNDEIKVINDYNLNIPRYIDSSDSEIIQNIDAHLNGGIPAFDVDSFYQIWGAFRSLKSELFKESERKGFYELKVQFESISDTVTKNKDFIEEKEKFSKMVELFSLRAYDILSNLKRGFSPDSVIESLENLLFDVFDERNIVNRYDIYQVLMDIVSLYLRDDLYVISDVGFNDACIKADWEYVKDKKGNEKSTGRLASLVLPPDVVSKKFFALEREKITKLSVRLEEIESIIFDLRETDGDDGILADVEEDGKISEKSIISKLKDGVSPREKEILLEYRSLLREAKEGKKIIKELSLSLNEAVLFQYSVLSEEEGRDLLIKEHWLKPIETGIVELFDSLIRNLEDGVSNLVKRYEVPLEILVDDSKMYEERVLGDLERMGFKW